MKSNYLYLPQVSYKKTVRFIHTKVSDTVFCFLHKKMLLYIADLLTLFFGFLFSFSAVLAPGRIAI